jgi:hypothetical protein
VKSRFLNKVADVPANFKGLPKPVSKETDAVKRVLAFFEKNNLDAMSWRGFTRNPELQQLATKYAELFTSIRENRPKITKADLQRFLAEAKGQDHYEVSYDRYSDGDTSFRDVEQLVLQINQGASAKRILSRDRALAQYLQMVGQSSGFSGHPARVDTVGWLRVDFVDADWLLVDEVQSDLVNSVTQAKAILEARNFQDFLNRLSSDKLREMAMEKIDERQFNMGKQQFMMAGYTVETLDAIKQKIVDLFKEWADYAISTIMEIAANHGIKNVALHTGETISRRDNAVLPSKITQYYDSLAKAFGFKRDRIRLGGIEGEFWVRKV